MRNWFDSDELPSVWHVQAITIGLIRMICVSCNKKKLWRSCYLFGLIGSRAPLKSGRKSQWPTWCRSCRVFFFFFFFCLIIFAYGGALVVSWLNELVFFSRFIGLVHGVEGGPTSNLGEHGGFVWISYRLLPSERKRERETPKEEAGGRKLICIIGANWWRWLKLMSGGVSNCCCKCTRNHNRIDAAVVAIDRLGSLPSPVS